jgi:uncharacterized protein DUF6585
MDDRGISGTSMPAEVRAAASRANLGAHELTLGELRRIRRNLITWIFAGGFIARSGEDGQLGIYPWAACHVNYDSTRRIDALGGTYGKEESVTVRHENGAIFSVSGQGNPDVSAFLKRAVDRITAAQLPRAWSALREGRRLDFGPVEVDDRRVYYKHKSVLWGEVASFEMRFGSLLIQRNEKRLRWVVSASRMWDLHVLLRVAEGMRRPADPNVHRASTPPPLPQPPPPAATAPAVPEQSAPPPDQSSYGLTVPTVPEAVAALARAAKSAPLLTPAQIEDEYTRLRKAWLGAHLSAAPLERIIGVVQRNLERDATRPEFMTFLVRLVDDQNCAQVTSLGKGLGTYRIWRSEQGYCALGSAHDMIADGIPPVTTPPPVPLDDVVTVLPYEHDPSHIANAESRTLMRSAVAELVNVGRAQGFLSDDGGARNQITEIGRRLDEVGGMTLMRLVHGEVARQLPSHSRELDAAWDGIGTWLG